MNWAVECAAVIPCLNEARVIGPLVREVRARLPTVIVIDDGSTDGTADAAACEGATVIVHDAPRGKGAALRAGWRAARQKGLHWVLMLDGDGQHSPEDIPKFFDCAEKMRAVLIIGNRMSQAERMPWVRRLVNRWMSRRLSRLAGIHLPDSQCGFRLAQLEALLSLPLGASHFETESEQVLAFTAAGLAIAFVPVSVIYQKERSKIHPWRDTVRWFRWLRQWRTSGRRE